MIKKYNSFLLENQITELINESKLVYSQKFINILNKIKNNKVSQALLDLYSVDIDKLKHNYLDISDKHDKVFFTQDNRIQNFLKDKPELYMVVETGRYLTHSDRNNKVFEILGYDKTENELWIPSNGQKGKILNEVIRPNGNIYVLFEELTDNENKRLSVLNKAALVLDEGDTNKIWNLNRTEVGIGKLANAILKSADLNFTNKEIEDFVNLYKATFELIGDVMSRFEIVKGGEIAYWYNIDQYESGGGTLNSSCMAESEDFFFDIYTQNPQVSLVILKSEDNPNKIKGRALLWDATIDGTKAQFMDRIYTRYDSDVEVFKEYAHKNGFWYKEVQNMENEQSITDGKVVKNSYIKVNLNYSDFDYYPYMDTLSYIDKDNDICMNINRDAHINARETDGTWEELSDY